MRPPVPDTIAAVLPGTMPLAEPGRDRRIDQHAEAVRWWDSRLGAARARRSSASAPRQRQRLVDATGADREVPPVATATLGPVDALDVLIVAAPDDPGADGWAALRALSSGGWRIVVPALVRREQRGDWCRRLAKDRRHILHRLAFPVGRSVLGMEAAGLAALARQHLDRRVVLAGLGEAALPVLLAAMVEPAPQLVLVADPARLTPPQGGGPIDRLIHASARLAPFGAWPEVVDALVEILPAATAIEDIVERLAPAARRDPAGAEAEGLRRASDRTWRRWRDALRAEIGATRALRAARWRLDDPEPARRESTARRLRAELSRSVGGRGRVALPPAAATTLLRVTDAFVAYEVVLSIDRDVSAWAHVLVPRRADGPWPVVIAQHGLDGQPGDVTGIRRPGDPPADSAYHEFGARLAERGYVVVAPYLTVPAPQHELIDPLVVRAAALGEQRSALERRKLHALVDWLGMTSFVDMDRIGYYGLSYGGHAALWIAALEPRIAAAVVSGHANDWTAKTTDPDDPRSFLAHPDEDFTVWRGLEAFTHRELVAAAWPRPTLIESAQDDPITRPDWLDVLERDVASWASAWQATDRVSIDRFPGVHEVTGTESFAFLDRWLRPDQPEVRDYWYTLPAGRDLPGIGGTSSATDPFVTGTVVASDALAATIRLGSGVTFAGTAIRASGDGRLAGVDIRYGTRPGAADLGVATIPGELIHPLWDLWHAAPVPARPLAPAASVHLTIAPVGPPGSTLTVYGPRPLGASDRRLRPAIRLLAMADRTEPTHEFARELLDGPEPELAWDPNDSPARPSRIEPHVDDPVLQTAARWVFEDLARVATEGAGAIAVRLEVDANAVHAGGPRSHTVVVERDMVRLVGRSARGVLAAAATLGERIATARALPVGRWERAERVRDRITTGVLPAGTRYAERTLPSAYTDGYLDRIARAGFTGLWVWLDLGDAAVTSPTLPELASPEAAGTLARLQATTEQAERFGLDIWVYLAIGYRRPIPDSFWAQYPELKGGRGWLAPALCTSDPRALAFHCETIGDILSHAPGVAGFTAIFDIEGLYFCGSEEEARADCPRCRHRSSEDLALEVLTNLDEAIRARGDHRRLVAWSYGWRPDWVERVIPRLPATIAVQADFTKGVPVTRLGITEPAGDYTLAEVGPSPVFRRLREASRSPARPFFAKTEHAISLETIHVPWLPGVDRLVDRAAAVRDTQPDGWFANWEHYGFLVPFPAQVVNAHAWDPRPDPETLLDELAIRRFGLAAAPHIRRAWTACAAAMAAFPYSDPVARSPGPLQKGPSQPLWLDPAVPASGSWRSWQNDLGWTAPWGPGITRASLALAAASWREGLAGFEAAWDVCTGADRRRLEADIRIVRTLIASLESTIAQIDWIGARDALAGASGSAHEAVLARLATIARDERARTVAILPVLDGDSRLGFAQDGGGVIRGGLFTPALVRRKLGLLDDLLTRELPAAGGPPTAIPWSGA